MRRTHWIQFCFRLEDAEKLGALAGVKRLPWEDLRLYRIRLIATVTARLKGALGPNEIRNFCYNYLRDCEAVTGASLVPGLQTVTSGQAFAGVPERPLFRQLEFVENPPVNRASIALAARGGNVPYLFRWEDTNRGMTESMATIHVSGVIGKRSVSPVLVNLTTGDLIGFRGRIPFGRTLTIAPAGRDQGQPRLAAASLDGSDVSASLYSMENFQMGAPFSLGSLAPKPLVPRLARGVNRWVFLALGLFDVRGLSRYFNAIAGDLLREGVFNQTCFDQSLFPSGPMAHLAVEWVETQPATFEVRVPRFLVREPPGSAIHAQAAEALEDSIHELRAAGVEGRVRFVPFAERQIHRPRVTMPWVVLDREHGSAGEAVRLALGAQFGESPLGSSRFE